MPGYSYFDYDQMTLLGIEVHSDELELLQKAAEEYDWEAIETEIEPKFREAAVDFQDQKHSFVCPRKGVPIAVGQKWTLSKTRLTQSHA